MALRFVPFLILCSFCSGLWAQEHVVDTVKIEGNKRTKTTFLRNLLKVDSGTYLDSLLIQDDVTRLIRLPSISNATFKVEQTNENGYKVIYRVEENFTLIPFANLFASSNDKFAFRIGVQEFNTFGRNITVGAFYQHDIFNSYGLSLRAPHLFGPKWGVAVAYNDFSTQEPVFFDNATANYKYGNKGIEVMGLHEFNFKNRIELGGSFFTEDYQYLSGATNPNVPQELNVDKHLLKLIYQYDNVRYHYQYLTGFKSSLNFQYVGSTDNNLPEFLIGFNDFVYYERWGDRGNWASRARLGLASNIETPFAPFTVDNNLNMRGVGNRIDRGTAAIVLNTEYRHTLIDVNWFVLQGNFFVDAGTWRNPGGDFGDFTDSENLRVYPGVGLRLMHKRIFNAIFRIDYGYGITKDASNGIVFGIGQYF